MYQKLNKVKTKAINELLQQQAALGKSLGVNNIQNNRFMRDYSVSDLVGVDRINYDLHGWDGIFKNGVYFENKNVKAAAKSGLSFALKFQDTSYDKLDQMVKDGVICTTTFWGDDGKIAFILLGNTRTVGDYLEYTYNPEQRRSSTVSLSRCLNRGFKLVAGNYTKKQVIDVITDKFPRLGKTLKPADIHTKKELKGLVNDLM